MKKVCRFLAVALCLTILANVAVMSIAAAEWNLVTQAVEGETYLGRLEDQTGQLLEDSEAAPPAASSSYCMFSMTASGVTTLLTTYGIPNKNFTRAKLDGGALYITGTLNNSTGQRNATSKVGVCTYNSQTGSFDAKTSDYFTPGEKETTGQYLYTIFESGETYYGYINNHYRYGEISGTISFYCRDLGIEWQALENNTNEREN